MKVEKPFILAGGFRISRCQPPSKIAGERWGQEWYAFDSLNQHGSAGKEMLKFYVGEEAAKEAITKLKEPATKKVKP